MPKFYFTYGTDPAYPFQGGWTEIEATKPAHSLPSVPDLPPQPSRQRRNAELR